MPSQDTGGQRGQNTGGQRAIEGLSLITDGSLGTLCPWDRGGCGGMYRQKASRTEPQKGCRRRSRLTLFSQPSDRASAGQSPALGVELLSELPDFFREHGDAGGS